MRSEEAYNAVAMRVAELEAQNARLRDVLRMVQWSNRGWVTDQPLYPHCPLCKRAEKWGHSPDCPLGLALGEA